jgi:hypothetical protein
MNRPKKHDRCETWPGCVCGDKWHQYQDGPIKDYESAEPNISAMLHCVREHCPDPRFRRQATAQLMQPVFAPYRQH